jgi:hypothetical protein
VADHEAGERGRIALQSGHQRAGRLAAYPHRRHSGERVLQRGPLAFDDNIFGVRRGKIGEHTGTGRQREAGERAGRRDCVEAGVFDQASGEHRQRAREAQPEQRARDLPA